MYAATQREYPLSDYTHGELERLQNSLKLKDEDIKLIEERISQEIEDELKKKRIQSLGVGFTAITVVAVGLVGALMNSQDRYPSRITSSASHQNASLTPAKNSEGWIFIGRVNNTSDSHAVKKPLIGGSLSIASAVVPSIGSVVTVKQRVSWRKNRPQKPNFDPKEQKLLGVIESGQKIVIVDTFVARLTSVYAEVRKCDRSCI